MSVHAVEEKPEIIDDASFLEDVDNDDESEEHPSLPPHGGILCIYI